MAQKATAPQTPAPQALALLEYASVSAGVAAVDRMLKESPVALLRCGSVHPGRYLALVGGTVAATAVAHGAGAAVGCERNRLADEVLLPDPHPALLYSPERDLIHVPAQYCDYRPRRPWENHPC